MVANTPFSISLLPLLFQKEKVEEEEEADMDPDVAAMMGFGGFRSSKK